MIKFQDVLIVIFLTHAMHLDCEASNKEGQPVVSNATIVEAAAVVDEDAVVIDSDELVCSPPRLKRVQGKFGAGALRAREKLLQFNGPGSSISLLTKPSPGEERIQLTNFHKQISIALKNGLYDNLADAFEQYFDYIPYNLVIKEKPFYLSLFYSIFKLISGDAVEYSKADETLAVLVKSDTDKHCVLEFCFNDRPGGIGYTMLLTSGLEVQVPIFRIQCEVECRGLELYLVEPRMRRTKNKKQVIFSEEDFAPIEYVQNNCMRNLLSFMADTDGLHDNFARNLFDLYDSVPTGLRIRSEKYYQSIFVLMSNFVRSGASQCEVITSRGRSDVVVLSADIINVIEFKINHSPTQALRQIKDRGYCDMYFTQKKPIRMVGINVKVPKNRKMGVSVLSETCAIPVRKKGLQYMKE